MSLSGDELTGGEADNSHRRSACNLGGDQPLYRENDDRRWKDYEGQPLKRACPDPLLCRDAINNETKATHDHYGECPNRHGCLHVHRSPLWEGFDRVKAIAIRDLGTAPRRQFFPDIQDGLTG